MSKFNQPGSGALITRFGEKDRLCECFINCLKYDWMHDSDIREVWAENGFYCIVDYLAGHMDNVVDANAGALDLFLLLCEGADSLKPKFNDILRKSAMRGDGLFSAEDYRGGADYLIREFSFFAVSVFAPMVKKHPQIINARMKPFFDRALFDLTLFSEIESSDIFKKMHFISRVIGSVLNDM